MQYKAQLEGNKKEKNKKQCDFLDIKIRNKNGFPVAMVKITYSGISISLKF